jgi:hypothetical protein
MRRIKRRKNNIYRASGPCHPQPVTQKVETDTVEDRVEFFRVNTKGRDRASQLENA